MFKGFFTVMVLVLGSVGFLFLLGCNAKAEVIDSEKVSTPIKVSETSAKPHPAECTLAFNKIEVKAGEGFFTNCYILFDPSSKEAVVVDPGSEPERILKHLKDKGFSLSGILLTHAHSDHTGGAKVLQEVTGAKLYLHPLQIKNDHWYDDLLAGLKTVSVKEGSIIKVGCQSLRCLHTPGHSPGGLTFVTPNELLAFTGDTLFAGSVGRTDFDGGSASVIFQQVNRLAGSLPAKTRVLPGHGNETTIGAEKQNNPYIQSASK